MTENGFTETPINDEVEKLSLELEQKYEIDNTSTGANQADIKLIAYAKLENKPVVTFEKMQTSKPDSKTSYKIPLICKEEEVDCLSFVEMLDRLGIKI